MWKRAGIVGALVALALVMVPAAARAQWTTPSFFGQQTLPTKFYSFYPHGGGKGHGHGGGHQQPTPPRPTARQRAMLRFRPVAAVTRRDEQQLVQPLVDSLGVTADDARAYAARATAAYDHNLAQMGWRLHNLGDVAAYYFFHAYTTYYHLKGVPSAGLASVRRGYGDGLAALPQLRRLSNRHKQELADALELNFVYYSNVAHFATENEDFTLEDEAMSAMRRWVQRAYGLNLDKVAITGKGLVDRL